MIEQRGHGRDLERLRNGLIVSCQAHGDHPLRDTAIIAALAECAERGGAAGVRADGPDDVAEIKRRVSLPVIGIYKHALTEERFSITPTLDHARKLAEAGADLIAIEATFENRPDDGELGRLLQSIRGELRAPVMADVSVFEEGVRAWEMGADLVATTLSGHTRHSRGREKPDLQLVGRLAEAGVRVVSEGHIRTPEHVVSAFGLGAFCVVVGTAITDPIEITSWFTGSTSDDHTGSAALEERGTT
ncbi:MAG: N-acetylmannosamine-6-phosphate 2-epimerase [Actinomycetota bacterium]|nr:N-acetylmannosamine-6-phosphate 2-epimerase [Actinomycetota bacterium]